MGETEKVVPEAEELPKAIVRRVVKDELSRCSHDGDISIHKDALLAFSESARIFIHYLSATIGDGNYPSPRKFTRLTEQYVTANDICKESKRQIISADDVFKALEETEYSEFVRPLKASLEEFRKKNAGKKAGASKEKDEKKKRKLEDESFDKDEGVDEK